MGGRSGSSGVSGWLSDRLHCLLHSICMLFEQFLTDATQPVVVPLARDVMLTRVLDNGQAAGLPVCDDLFPLEELLMMNESS